MYIQITTRCKMTCAHCMFSCSPDGLDMPVELYDKAIRLSALVGDERDTTLGGGEPTDHPRFYEYYCRAVATLGGVPFVVTNGTNTEQALFLATMNDALLRADGSCARLSRDQYHDLSMVDERVLEAFPKKNYDHLIEPFPVGRALETGEHGGIGSTFCPCSTNIITPTGVVYVCGCQQGVLGDLTVDSVEFLSDVIKTYRSEVRLDDESDRRCITNHGEIEADLDFIKDVRASVANGIITK